jgi:hypothetical protein
MGVDETGEKRRIAKIMTVAPDGIAVPNRLYFAVRSA